MRSKARDYKDSTVKKLFSLAYNECSFPGCPQKFARDDRDDFQVNICHIEAAETDGQRYNPAMTDDERRSYENLILLCPIHHIETNDVVKYPVEALQEMKRNHQAAMLKQFASEGVLTKYPSSLVEVINRISVSDLFGNLDPPDETVTNSYGIEDKIAHNNVKRYKWLIEEYKVYQGKLNKIYDEIEQQGSFKKEQLLQNIKSLYLKAKMDLLGENPTITNIQEKADDLIEAVERGLSELVEKSSNLGDSTPSRGYQSQHIRCSRGCVYEM